MTKRDCKNFGGPFGKGSLQKQLLEKVKEGIKPSDLKRKKASNQSDQIDRSIPKAPPLPNQNLLDQITSLKKQLQTYKDFKEADLKIKEKLKGEIEELKIKSEQSERSLSDLNKSQQQKNNEYKEKVKELQTKIQVKDKTIESLKNQANNKANDKGEVKDQPINKTFFCDSCQLTKQGIYIKRKVDAPFEPRIHQRVCYLCSDCSPYVKELSEINFDKDNNPYKID